MTEVDETDARIEQQIRKHVDRVGKTVAGEFNEATKEGAVKYHIKVHQTVDHLESLCMPLIDEEYEDKKEEILDEDSKNSNSRGNENKLQLLGKAKTKYRLLIDLLHRKGVL